MKTDLLIKKTSARTGDAAFAGVIEGRNGETEVVLAGGHRRGSDAEIFSPASNAWRNIEPMPHAAYDGASVQYGDSFLAIGGSDGDTNSQDLDSVHRFDVETDSWVELPHRMEEARAFFPAFLVPEDFVEC